MRFVEGNLLEIGRWIREVNDGFSGWVVAPGADGVKVVKQFARPVPSRSVGAVWRKSTARTEAITAVCDVINSSMAS